MSDDFAGLIDTANAFFAELKANNRKDWFEPRKTHYRDAIRKPAELLADLLAEDLGRLTGKPQKPKVFRVHRDVRFSADKTPYNPHLHLMWSQAGVDLAPVWFFGASPDYLIVGAGLPGLSGPALNRYRALVDEAGSELAAAIETAQANGAELSDWGPPPLKRVPKPYAPDHPQAELLKRKALTMSAPLPEGWRETGLVAGILAAAGMLHPVWTLLDAGLGSAH